MDEALWLDEGAHTNDSTCFVTEYVFSGYSVKVCCHVNDTERKSNAYNVSFWGMINVKKKDMDMC